MKLVVGKKYRMIKYCHDGSVELMVGDIVTLAFDDGTSFPLFELPERLHGKGHGGSRYNENNYFYISKSFVEKLDEEVSEKLDPVTSYPKQLKHRRHLKALHGMWRG